MKRKISIIGAGGFGWAWALILAWAGYDVTLWSRRPAPAGYPYQWLLQYSTPSNLTVRQVIISPEIARGELVIIATPALDLLGVAERLDRCRCQEVITLQKGSYGGTTPHDLLSIRLPQARLAHITGAAFSEQLVAAINRGVRMDVVVASESMEFLLEIREILRPTSVHPVISSDPRSVQLAFALRPVVSFMQGLASGYVGGHPQYQPLLPLIMSKMMSEGRRIALAMGADEKVSDGVDEILTADYLLCMGEGSRNFATGYECGSSGQIPTGESPRGVVEALNTIRQIYGFLVNCELGSTEERAEAAVFNKYPYLATAHSYLYRGKPLVECAEAILARR